MDDIYENIEGYNSNKNSKTLTVFSTVWLLICLVIKKINQIISELFIIGRKVNISLVFIIQPYFAVSKNIRLISLRSFITKFLTKQDIEKIPFNH